MPAFTPASFPAIGKWPSTGLRRARTMASQLLSPIHQTPTAAVEPVPDTRVRVRVRLRPRGPAVSRGFVDGGWWPRSSDLTAEVPPLLAGLGMAGADVRQVVFHIDAWDPAPRRLGVSGRGRVTLSGYYTLDAALITLVDTSGWEHINLAVIPPGTDAVIATRALTLAGRAADRHRPGEILELAGRVPILSPAGPDSGSLDGWESDGGRVRPI
jgi:hypothetical protein